MDRNMENSGNHVNQQDQYAQQIAKLVGELLDGIDVGDFSVADKIPEKYTYGHLSALFRVAYGLDNGIELYEQLYDLAMKKAVLSIRNKANRGDKIRIAFLVLSAAEWPAEEVYRLFEQDPRCESYIVLCPLVDGTKREMIKTYKEVCHFFDENRYFVKKAYDEENDRHLEWKEIGGVPDIVIHLKSWYDTFLCHINIETLPLRCINCYIPYGFYLADSQDGQYIKNFVYNKEFVNMAWKIYTDSERNAKGYQKYELLHGKNVFYSGYTKMDYFYHQRNLGEKDIERIWKIQAGVSAEKIKKIIIAPHHSFKGYGGIEFSTFASNMYYWIYLAKKYKDKISFIFKPHPHLHMRAVEAGIFKDTLEYEAYLNEWDKLPNAKVVQEEDYRDIFVTSDGMIMDSISFLAEYMYVNKPLLFLRKQGQVLNDLGQKLLGACYQVQGEDYIGIEAFILHTILEENDEQIDRRREIFKEELDYLEKNQCFASMSIYRDITSLF